MICLVEDIVNADTRNKFKHFAYGKGVSSIQVYYAIARSILLTSSLKKYVFHNWLINNILYFCVT